MMIYQKLEKKVKIILIIKEMLVHQKSNDIKEYNDNKSEKKISFEENGFRANIWNSNELQFGKQKLEKNKQCQ